MRREGFVDADEAIFDKLIDVRSAERARGFT
jgi:hypothetical protein